MSDGGEQKEERKGHRHQLSPFINVLFSSVCAVVLGTGTPRTSFTAALAQPGKKPPHNLFISAKFSVLQLAFQLLTFNWITIFTQFLLIISCLFKSQHVRRSVM